MPLNTYTHLQSCYFHGRIRERLQRPITPRSDLGRLILFCLLSAILSGCLQQRGGFDILSAERPVLHRNHGIVRKPVEVGVRTPNSGSTHHVLIANPHINSLVLRAADGRVLVRTGDSLPFFQRPLPHRQFILPLPVSDSVGKLALSLSKAGENLFYEIRLLDDAALKDYLAEDLLLTGFLIGFYMLAIHLSLALLLYKPTVKYLCFWLYIVFSLAWILGDSGLLYPWLWSGPLHHFDAMLFFPFQCLFMAAHLYNRERRREREAEKRQAQLSLSQQREADRRVREVEE